MNKRQQRAMKIAAQQALVSGAAGRELTAEESAQFDALQREIDALTLEIEAEERQAAAGQQQAAGIGTPAAASQEDAATRAVAEERQRVQSISDLCREFNVDPAEHIRTGATIDQVRAAILEGMKAAGSPANVQVTRDEGDTFRQRVTDALMLRAGVHIENPAEGANEFRAMSLRDLGIECLSRESQNIGTLLRMSSDEIYSELSRQFYNPSAAFPAILDSTIRKSIVQLYSQVPTTFEAITTKGSLKDFKQTADHEYVIGGVGDFLIVPENGEIKPDKPRTELLPQRKLDTYGKQFSMTRQAFINDDIGFLTEVPGLYATAAKKTINKQVYTVLFKNAKVFDGLKLFCENHKNIMKTGSKPSQASIQAMVTKMGKQTDHFDEPIYITPTTIVVPIGYEFDLSVIFHSAQVVGSNNNDINPLYNYPLKTVQDPVLNALAGDGVCPWFMFGSGARGIQVDYLNGQETPTVRRMEVPGTLGFVWDIYLDWGIAVRDFRSMAMNPGVKIPSEE
ncbi:hypothetical protein IMSAGC012_02653 [Lachnospiraceae bacterium]|nr:hypothetical protein IMSAGC012_02653 [Lachnospiraceae bacterium]